ncbi:MAG TPA: hypothetical protein PKC98_02560 [Candidatus Melainabacteria bacterium]|nr:hypothetical protein [Candidatus Melainabacteria bacterium]
MKYRGDQGACGWVGILTGMDGAGGVAVILKVLWNAVSYGVWGIGVKKIALLEKGDICDISAN